MKFKFLQKLIKWTDPWTSHPQYQSDLRIVLYRQKAHQHRRRIRGLRSEMAARRRGRGLPRSVKLDERGLVTANEVLEIGRCEHSDMLIRGLTQRRHRQSDGQNAQQHLQWRHSLACFSLDRSLPSFLTLLGTTILGGASFHFHGSTLGRESKVRAWGPLARWQGLSTLSPPCRMTDVSSLVRRSMLGSFTRRWGAHAPSNMSQ